ncbi:hypothetical protein CDAR_1071 [Caerostris darwini]|uniref:IGFBP N-terminal domain-containing protein n=1 Tax=Caerostris darwini TaxID=1538125 RepID=A0AAV4SPC6_9ARAC|nr:hypothetical protein CDAR_881 [Caerostris darwini]GIY35302.1 hypothetical protein CDAR_1071 [Caerostris darwini]
MKCDDLKTCETCAEKDCKCGSVMDECNCCAICLKCAGETCHDTFDAGCEDGYTCGDPNRSLLDKINIPATCIKKED